jgi:hypothetical protein
MMPMEAPLLSFSTAWHAWQFEFESQTVIFHVSYLTFNPSFVVAESSSDNDLNLYHQS